MFEKLKAGLLSGYQQNLPTNRTFDEKTITKITNVFQQELLNSDTNPKVVDEIVSLATKKLAKVEIKPTEIAQNIVKTILHNSLIEILTVGNTNLQLNKNITTILVVGLNGSGKTTSTAKLAWYLKYRMHKKVLVVGLDIHRAAAMEQLETLLKPTEIECSVDEHNLSIAIQQAMAKAKQENFDIILYDTAGRTHVNELLKKEILLINQLVNPTETLLVVDALSGMEMVNVAKTFVNWLTITGLIITKIDADESGGAILSINHLLKLPSKFMGDGEKISDFGIYNPERLVNILFDNGDIEGLISEFSNSDISEKKSIAMLQKMFSGRLTMNDLLKQIQQAKKISRWNRLIQKIPGLGKKLQNVDLGMIKKEISAFEAIILSMTTKERENPRLIIKSNSRKQRIINGSKRSPMEYNRLMKRYSQLKTNSHQLFHQLTKMKF